MARSFKHSAIFAAKFGDAGPHLGAPASRGCGVSTTSLFADQISPISGFVGKTFSTSVAPILSRPHIAGGVGANNDLIRKILVRFPGSRKQGDAKWRENLARSQKTTAVLPGQAVHLWTACPTGFWAQDDFRRRAGCCCNFEVLGPSCTFDRIELPALSFHDGEGSWNEARQARGFLLAVLRGRVAHQANHSRIRLTKAQGPGRAAVNEIAGPSVLTEVTCPCAVR